MIFAKISQGQLTSLLGTPKKLSVYLIGNPVIANRMFERTRRRRSLRSPSRLALRGPVGHCSLRLRPPVIVARLVRGRRDRRGGGLARREDGDAFEPPRRRPQRATTRGAPVERGRIVNIVLPSTWGLTMAWSAPMRNVRRERATMAFGANGDAAVPRIGRQRVQLALRVLFAVGLFGTAPVACAALESRPAREPPSSRPPRRRARPLARRTVV